MPTKSPLPIAIDYYDTSKILTHKFRGTLTSLDHLVLAVALNRPDNAVQVVIDLALDPVTPPPINPSS